MPRHPTDDDTNALRPCEWCGTLFRRRSLHGRPPRYCKASHRVRACERRRGLLRPGQRPSRTNLPPPADYVGPPLGRIEHDEGKTHGTATGSSTSHAPADFPTPRDAPPASAAP